MDENLHSTLVLILVVATVHRSSVVEQLHTSVSAVPSAHSICQHELTKYYPSVLGMTYSESFPNHDQVDDCTTGIQKKLLVGAAVASVVLCRHSMDPAP